MDSIKKAKEILTALATTKEEKASARSSIKELKEEIRAARKAGKKWKEIALALESAGVKATPQALSSLCSIKKKKTIKEDTTKKELTKKIETKAVAGPTEKKNVFASGNSNILADGSFKITPDRDVFKKSN